MHEHGQMLIWLRHCPSSELPACPISILPHLHRYDQRGNFKFVYWVLGLPEELFGEWMRKIWSKKRNHLSSWVDKDASWWKMEKISQVQQAGKNLLGRWKNPASTQRGGPTASCGTNNFSAAYAAGPPPENNLPKPGASTQSAAEIMHQSPPTKLARKMEQGNSDDPWGRNIMMMRSPDVAVRQDEQRSNVELSKHWARYQSQQRQFRIAQKEMFRNQQTKPARPRQQQQPHREAPLPHRAPLGVAAPHTHKRPAPLCKVLARDGYAGPQDLRHWGLLQPFSVAFLAFTRS